MGSKAKRILEEKRREFQKYAQEHNLVFKTVSEIEREKKIKEREEERLKRIQEKVRRSANRHTSTYNTRKNKHNA